MLRITVEIIANHGPRKIATAIVGNMSNLADVSDYQVAVRTEARELPTPDLAWESRGMIAGHDRRQSVWALVAKAAAWAAAEAEKRT